MSRTAWVIGVVVLGVTVAAIAPFVVVEQGTGPEPLKGADRNAYQDMKQLKAPAYVAGDDKKTTENRALLTKQAKYMVGQLTDPAKVKLGLASVIEQAITSDLPIIRINRPKEITEE